MNYFAAFLFASLVSLAVLGSCDSSKRQAAPQPSQKPPVVALAVPQFNKAEAFKYLTTQTDFGPRVPATTASQRCLAWFLQQLQSSADTVLTQRFSYKSYKGEQYVGTNVIARFNLFMNDRIILTAHWDSRPWADQDSSKANHSKPIVGANDGASGVAVLLELARIFKTSPPPQGIDIVLYDGEDVGGTGYAESFAQGSQYFAKHLPDDRRYRYAINLDMIGDRNLEIDRESNSDAYAPTVMDNVFSTARLLGISQFSDKRVGGIYDDHMPLNNVNIPAIDLIDFNYPDDSNRYWHTTQDTPDKCSPESLEAVGIVLLNVLYVQGSGS